MQTDTNKFVSGSDYFQFWGTFDLIKYQIIQTNMYACKVQKINLY